MAAPVENKVRWGILGSGYICSDFVQSLRSTEGAEITAVAARSLPRAQAFADANGIPTAYGSYAELMAADDVDIIYIGTIHPAHKVQAIAAMNAGKHVLCEKPMTCSKADTEELVKVAREKGLFLAEAMWTRFFPTVIKAREIIASRGIGQVKGMHGDFGFTHSGVDDPLDQHRLTNLSMAGGATLDIGVYVIACMLLATGPTPPLKTTAVGTLTASGCDKHVSVSCISATNQVASMTWTIECKTPEEYRILGTEGMIVFEGPAHTPLKMKVIKPGVNREDPPFVEEMITPMPALMDGANKLNFPISEGFVYQAEAVTAAVKAGKLEMAEFTLEESIIMAGICDDVLQQVGVKYPSFDGKF